MDLTVESGKTRLISDSEKHFGGNETGDGASGRVDSTVQGK